MTIRFGPVKGYRWIHRHRYQPWMALGIYEPATAAAIEANLGPGAVFYDVGANAGYFALVGAKAVGTEGSVVAFDPVPENVATIRQQAAINGLIPVCRAEALALYSRECTMELVVPSRNANAHLARVHAPHVGKSNRGDILTVACTTLDRYVAKNPPPRRS